MPEISVLVEGGKASAGAPLGPALGPMGVNIGEVVAKINEKTKEFSGMKVPVKVIVDAATKSFDVQVGSPPVSALIKKEIRIESGAKNPKLDKAGDITLEQLKKIAKMKMDALSSYKLKSAVREIAGACNSMGVYIEGKHAKEFQNDLASGMYDEQLKD